MNLLKALWLFRPSVIFVVHYSYFIAPIRNTYVSINQGIQVIKTNCRMFLCACGWLESTRGVLRMDSEYRSTQRLKKTFALFYLIYLIFVTFLPYSNFYRQKWFSAYVHKVLVKVLYFFFYLCTWVFLSFVSGKMISSHRPEIAHITWMLSKKE